MLYSNVSNNNWIARGRTGRSRPRSKALKVCLVTVKAMRTEILNTKTADAAPQSPFLIYGTGIRNAPNPCIYNANSILIYGNHPHKPLSVAADSARWYDMRFMSRSEDRPVRVGLPFRTRNEELHGERAKIEPYLRALRDAGAQPVEISLGLSDRELRATAEAVDAILLPGSPADVDPARYRAGKHESCGPIDRDRDRTDFALLGHALAEKKPVLAICYGIQSLNVFLGGTLVQDIAAEKPSAIRHKWDRVSGAPEPFHAVEIEPDTRTASMWSPGEARVNSSHHQCIRDLGRGLRIAARAEDGVIEAVEGTGPGWTVGVQWHPERMVETDAAAQSLFREFCRAVASHRASHSPAGANRTP